MNYETLSAEESDEDCSNCLWFCLCPFPPVQLVSKDYERMDSRTRASVEIHEAYETALASLGKTEDTITTTMKAYFSDLRDGDMERIEWYRDEITWYNNNRRQILKALLTLLELYQDAYSEETSEKCVSLDILQQVHSLQRDLKAWSRTRTEQAQVERNLQRAFKVRRPGRPRVTGRASDSEYTDFSGVDTDTP